MSFRLGHVEMSDRIDSRGVSISVRPLTAHERKRWPDAEIVFTIHYVEGLKAHALTKVKDAEKFANTIKQVCNDVRKGQR